MNKFKEFFKKNKEIIIPTVVMICICFAVTAALSGTNLLTVQKIADITEQEQNSSMKEVIKADKYEEKTDYGFTYYVALKGNKTVGYVFVTSEKGYGGDDKVMTAVGIDGTVKAVKVLDVSNETPGLGQNTGNKDFYGQYSGHKGGIKVVKNGADRNKNEINAVTGATISSKAVTEAVNKALSEYDKISVEENIDEK